MASFDFGQYQDQDEKTGCKDCDNGMYQDVTGSTVCKQCRKGTNIEAHNGEGENGRLALILRCLNQPRLFKTGENAQIVI